MKAAHSKERIRIQEMQIDVTISEAQFFAEKCLEFARQPSEELGNALKALYERNGLVQEMLRFNPVSDAVEELLRRRGFADVEHNYALEYLFDGTYQPPANGCRRVGCLSQSGKRKIVSGKLT